MKNILRKSLVLIIAGIVIFFTLLSSVQAQNLVPNSSFEILNGYPYSDCMIYRATGWNSWNSSPDLANICCNVPDGLGCGYQYPATGDSYAVINLGPPVLNGGETIGIELSQPLIIGQKYFVSFKANLCDNPSCNCGLDKLGALFTTYSHAIDSMTIISTCPFSPYDSSLVKNFAHVYSNQIIIDTMNWTSVSGSFIADSVYQYITIGLFFDNSHITMQKVDENNPNCGAAYLIDDVYVGIDSIVSISNNHLFEYINLYPNPFSESAFFCYLLSDNKEIYFKIFNITGQDVTNLFSIEKLDNSKYIISRENIGNGIYFLKSKINKNIFLKKLIIIN